MKKLNISEDFWSVVIAFLFFGGFFFWIYTGVHHYQEKVREENPPLKCEPYDNTEACDHSEPLDASDLYEPDGATTNENPGYHSVNGYYRNDGTHVDSYIRSNPDGNPNNNLGGK